MDKANKSGFTQFLTKLGFASAKNEAERFVYSLEINQNQKADIEFIYAPTALGVEKIAYENHRRLWNSSSAHALVVVTETQTIVINPKVKPEQTDPFRGKIDSFEAGVKTNTNLESIQFISCKKINAGYFFEFIREKTKRNKEQEVDKDLLLNLIALRRDLIAGNASESVADLLILRCLFLKYLEDREIYPPNYVSEILGSGQSEKLIQAFNVVARINGDIFSHEPLQGINFSGKQMQDLHRFFNSDYRSGQGTLFPYQFQYIPIQLISHVYEAFLNESKKQGKGIYYTPQFIVRFMLEETLVPVLNQNFNVTVMDPACGSGAFLVESFRKIVQSKHVEKDFEEKKAILVDQIFGIDNDAQALRIAVFSLYLALLEDLDAVFIRKQIEDNAPILPSLIGKNLLHGNTLTNDGLFESRTFGCIVGNPPWGSVPEDKDPEHIQERKVLGGKGKAGLNLGYQFVSDFQRSQAFLLRVSKWASPETLLGLIVNNSIFLNEHAHLFRQFFLSKNKLIRFYELSHLNKILFRKKIIGKIANKTIEIGASEPAAFLVFSIGLDSESKVQYTTPRLTALSEFLHIVHFTQRDVKSVQQKSLLEDDSLWKILVNASWDDYQLITQKTAERDSAYEIECRSGFQPKKDMVALGEPDFRPLVKSADIDAYFVNENLGKFNWNQSLHRRRDVGLFQDERLLIPVRPTGSDNFRLRLARITGREIFQDDVLVLKIKHSQEYLKDYLPFLGLLNSSFLGYCSFLSATQWGKGDLKRSTLRNNELEKIPFPYLNENDPHLAQLTEAVLEMERLKKDPFGGETETLQKQIDELVFDLYGLLDFEKETVREFYDIHVHRKGAQVTEPDLENYAQKFKSVFELMLAEHLTLCCEYKISRQFGAFICFKIIENNANFPLIRRSNLEDEAVFHAVKQAQLEDALDSNRLNELPTRVYTPERFFLIKSHFYKDWTIRQAIEDANEEVKIMMQEINMNA